MSRLRRKFSCPLCNKRGACKCNPAETPEEAFWRRDRETRDLIPNEDYHYPSLCAQAHALREAWEHRVALNEFEANCREEARSRWRSRRGTGD